MLGASRTSSHACSLEKSSPAVENESGGQPLHRGRLGPGKRHVAHAVPAVALRKDLHRAVVQPTVLDERCELRLDGIGIAACLQHVAVAPQRLHLGVAERAVELPMGDDARGRLSRRADLAKIHIAKKDLALADEDYRAILNGVILIGVEPSEDLLAAARRAPPDPEPEPEQETEAELDHEQELDPEPDSADEPDIPGGALLEWEKLPIEPVPVPDPFAALDALRESLLEWEELRLEPYELSGAWHVCVGHRIGGPGADDHRAYTREECLELIEADMAEGLANAERVLGPETWAALSAGRRAVLEELAIIVGAEGLAGFGQMLEAVRAGDFERAGDEIILSLLPRQDQIGPDRTRDLASRMRAG